MGKEKGAPFVSLSPAVVERVMKIGKIKKRDIFYDLGSGDGRLVIAAAMKGAKAYGVEKDFLRVIYSRLWIRLLRLEKSAKIIHEDLFKVNLKKATVVHLFLLQSTNDKIEAKLKKELEKGTRVVSTAFEFKRLKLDEIDPRGPIYGPIYLYRI
ncbi:hypothetical protein A2Z22_02890 [Candidatus Woesebacteria bacterium RBG_16_34_12]|uniref:DOT1 domain-containing protein n=1 Tax=Candidatus Woesebacteria bacterium RBG_16_34_12 TaxID=1802480 RepID=A0A1F7X7A0_9BACT|nr:MAG: hypothetical protein A2Z22_02890 [Candidatus Woesebacteria bacterium RBG_16_34_12]